MIDETANELVISSQNSISYNSNKNAPLSGGNNNKSYGTIETNSLFNRESK